jgi:hypothetical protein
VERSTNCGPRPERGRCFFSLFAAFTTQRGILATHWLALLRSRGRPSLLHRTRGKGSALPPHPSRGTRDGYPTERGGPPTLVGLSPGLCGPGGTVAYITHRTVTSRPGMLAARLAGGRNATQAEQLHATSALSSCRVRLYDRMKFGGNRGGQARETAVPEGLPFSKAGRSISRRSGNGVT